MTDLDPQLLVFGGSLIAIVALAGLARWLGLGGNPTLRDDAAVIGAAGEVEDGFVATRMSISRGGTAALAADGAGRIMVIKRHGNRFAGRILTRSATAREEVDGLVVDCGEAQFGPVRLSLTDSSAWADRINRL
jgi:hypothetical protein